MESKITCELCKKQSLSSKAKYIPKGKDSKMLICGDCYAKRSSIDSTSPYYVKSDAPKKNYFCKRCRYNFKHEPTKLGKLACPYCGKDDQLLEKKTITAAEILNNLDY